MGTYGPWSETPYESHSSLVWYARGSSRSMNKDYSYHTGYYGVRPAIEVLKTAIDY